jgi:hypothetical protein
VQIFVQQKRSLPVRACRLAGATLVAAIASLVIVRAPAGAQQPGGISEHAQLPIIQPLIPQPSDSNLLFFIQRSTNANTVVYAAKLAAQRQLHPTEPVEVYWRRFAGDGARVSLDFFERHAAYGIEIQPIPGRPDAVQANLVSARHRPALVEIDEKGRPRAVIRIGVRLAKLIYAYVLVDESRTIPSVRQVDIFAADLSTGKFLQETVRP